MFAPNYFAPGYFAAAYWPPLGPGTQVTWENSNILTRVTRGTQLTTAALPPGEWRILIKAFDTSGNESVAEAVVTITLVNANVVVSSDEQSPRWPGVKTNFVRHDVSGKLVPQSQNLASADGWETFDDFVPNPFPLPAYETLEIDLGFDSAMRIYAELEAALRPGDTGIADPQLEIDYRVEAGAFGGFQAWVVGTVTARVVKARVKIDTATGVAALKSVRLVLDIEERTERGALTVAAGGTAVTFAKAFHVVPVVDVVAEALTGPLVYRAGSLADLTTTGFTAHVFDSAGVSVGGDVIWSAEGV